MTATTFAATLRQHCQDAPRPHRDADCRVLYEASIPYCLAKLSYAAGEDEAGDAAYERFCDITSAEEREQIEAELGHEYRNVAAWASCLTYEADRNTAKLAALKAIAAFGARSAWAPVIAAEAAQAVAA